MQPSHECPACDAGETFEFLYRESVPVHQNLLMSGYDDAIRIGRGQLRMRACRHCGFVYNAAFDPSLLNYSAQYDNTQTYSSAFENHIEGLARYLIDERDVRNCLIVEVGCGKGRFLRRLVEPVGPGNRGHGFDPSYVGPESQLDGKIVFEKRLYDERCVDVPADVVVCRHVIEHIERPLTLLRAIRRALGDRPGTRVFFETPCVRWILQNQVAWDFFYEHCSLFTSDSLATAFEQTGFRVASVSHVFHGQYLWLEAVPSAATAGPTHCAGRMPKLATEYQLCDEQRNDTWRGVIRQKHERGQVAIWGAGAKGVTFANLVDPERRWISCVVDLNPQKQGKFLPGTGHPIVSPRTLLDRDVASVVVLNPNYRQEISQLLASFNANIDVIDLMSQVVEQQESCRAA